MLRWRLAIANINLAATLGAAKINFNTTMLPKFTTKQRD